MTITYTVTIPATLGAYTNSATGTVGSTTVYTTTTGTTPATATLSNVGPATLTISKISNGGTGTFAFSGTNGVGNQNITTASAGVAQAGTTQTLNAMNTATSITETPLPGYVLSSATCTGMGSGGTATLSGNVLTLNAAATTAGSYINCTFTNTKLPTLTISKISTGGTGTFGFSDGNGYTDSITTLTAGATKPGTTKTLAAVGVSTTITETAPTGYTMTNVSCTGGGTVIPNYAAGTFTLDATATEAGNTISCTVSNAFMTYSISGQVYEDYNYGGGAGRAYNLGQGMSLRPGVRVELYGAAGGNVLALALTDSGGAYTFPNQFPGNYKVRAVNNFVTSSRAGGCTPSTLVGTAPTCSQLPVQTFINSASQVGGANPAGTDPALSSTILPTNAQSVAAVSLSSANVTGVDFGYSFSTVVNAGDAATPGQGSLRQFIVNANALANTSLAQSGNRGAVVTGANEALPAARDTSIFMIPSGALTGGVAIITVGTTAALPTITRSSVSIDGTTQTINIGNTNAGTLGTSGTVGYINTLTLNAVQKPEVQLVGSSATLLLGLDLAASNLQVRGLSVYGFGSTANNNNSANIRINSGFSNTRIEANILGSSATAFPCGGSATSSGIGDNIRSVSGVGGVVQNNLIGCSAGKGFGVEANSVNWLIVNNEIRGNGVGNTNLDGIDLENAGSKNHTVRGNLIAQNAGVGVDGYQGGGGNTVTQNTITGNGTGQGGAPGETAGVRVYSSGNTISNNVIALNYGAGVMVVNVNSGNLISQNSIYDNGTVLASSGAAASNQIGIDLLAAGNSVTMGTAPYVTKNDSSDADTGGNDLLNFPVFNTAQIVGSNLVLTGFVRPGSTIELFIAAADASGFGEGKTYLVTLTEGSAADTDSGTGTYTDANAGTDTTNRFSFSVPLPAGVSTGTRLTATATCSSASCPGTTVSALSETSEFSYNVAVTAQPPALTLLKLGRNISVLPSQPFIGSAGSIGVKPGETVEYCIVYSNTGGVASNFVLQDYVPVGMVAQPSAYGTNVGGDALGLKYAVGVALAVNDANSDAVTPTLTSKNGDDAGTLSTAPVTNPGDPASSPQRPGVMTLTLPTVAANSKGTVCFQARVP
ncbi:beta strand repeat-containing protein [Deinococcus sp. SM5_A1]|uniref:beta strand repeat-containing protein n=1 Tax=Deinococcus sp. SM5_A1 TaxID=3379094 RepID=UPI00385910FF